MPTTAPVAAKSNPVQRAVGALLIATAWLVDEFGPWPETVGVPLPRLARGADPVVLIAGIPDGGGTYDQWERSLRRDGFDPHRITLPGRGMDDVMTAARYLSREIERIRRRTGAAKVDLVGYSQGGLVARAFVELLGGASAVDSLVTVATPHNGIGLLRHLLSSILGRAVLPAGVADAAMGSELLRRLEGRPLPAAVRYTSVFTEGPDGVIWPSGSPLLEGARLVRLPNPGMRPDHVTIMHSSDAAYEAVRAALLVAAERLAERGERGEPDSLGASVLQH